MKKREETNESIRGADTLVNINGLVGLDGLDGLGSRDNGRETTSGTFSCVSTNADGVAHLGLTTVGEGSQRGRCGVDGAGQTGDGAGKT